jgi:hypothetical protein
MRHDRYRPGLLARVLQAAVALVERRHRHRASHTDPEAGWVYCRCGARARLRGVGPVEWEGP